MKRLDNSSNPLHLCPPSLAQTDARTCFGTLARIANDESMVFVMFDNVSPPAHFEDIGCADLDGVTTPLSDEDRFELS